LSSELPEQQIKLFVIYAMPGMPYAFLHFTFNTLMPDSSLNLFALFVEKNMNREEYEPGIANEANEAIFSRFSQA